MKLSVDLEGNLVMFLFRDGASRGRGGEIHKTHCYQSMFVFTTFPHILSPFLWQETNSQKLRV